MCAMVSSFTAGRQDLTAELPPVKTRIVVADNDLDILDLVVFKLTQACHDAVAVSDGVAALEAIEADPPSLAILDVMMPGLSSMDVLRKVRASEATKDLDIILLTARARDFDVDTGFATGVSDYVMKPFTPREFIHRVNALLTRDTARRSAVRPS